MNVLKGNLIFVISQTSAQGSGFLRHPKVLRETVSKWIFIANMLVIYKKRQSVYLGGGRKRRKEEGQAM